MAHEAHHDDHHAPLHEGDDLPHHGPVIEEPRSPMWLPYLGLAFAGLLLVWWLSMPTAKEEAEAAAAAASASASAAAAPTVTAVPAPPAPGGDPHAGHDHPHGGGPAGNLGNVKIAPAAEVNPHFKK